MKGILKKVGALLAAMRSAVSHVALVAVRAADGAISYVLEVVASIGSSGVTASVDYTPDLGDIEIPEPLEPVDDLVLAQAGDLAVRAAQAIVKGKPVPTDIPQVVALYIQGLHRDDQWLIAATDAVVVGRHLAGIEDLKSSIGVVLRRPEPEADAEREVARKKKLAIEADRKASLQAENAAAARRARFERVEWEAGLLSPAMTLTP